MNKLTCILLLSWLMGMFFSLKAQEDSVALKTNFEGQLSVWGLYHLDGDLPVWLGGRYLPELNLEMGLKNRQLLDAEISGNIFGNTGTHPFDTTYASGSIKPYRIWTRYSNEQLEIRVGLQKINFGSAMMLRPLMWFDQIDPRDPLQITDGVWGVLGRYYFLNNANIWLWGLYGNENRKGFETIGTHKNEPEWGGRIQHPVKNGELALSFHHRVADSREIGNGIDAIARIPENRFGIDGKWDVGVGLWFEGSWINKRKDLGPLTNQTILNTGMDYTFGVGNGLTMVFEQILFAADEKPFEFKQKGSFSALNLSYPVSLFDNMSAIVYYDWTNHGVYNFLNWQRTFNTWTLNLMAYWNPDNAQLPQQQQASTNLFSGKGVQILIVYNH